MEHSIAIIALSSGVISLLCLLILHFVSPEFDPGWRMISEYALGRYKWLITAFFILWGVSSVFVCVMLWPVVSGIWGRIGLILLLISAVGEIMGGLFDVRHKLHGMSFLLGVPALPVAALLISYNIIHLERWHDHATSILYSAHSTWISLVLMGVGMAVMMSGFKKAGLPMDKDAAPPEKLPEGVIAWAGYANRLLVLCYVMWLVQMAGIVVLAVES